MVVVKEVVLAGEMAEEMAESSHFGLPPIAEGTEADEVRAQIGPQVELQ